MNYFNDITELSPNEINFLLELSERLELNPEPDALKGKVLGLLFLNPSLRTMTSFQSAMIRLGGGSFVVSPDMSIHGLETKDDVIMDEKSAEHIKEAIPVISSYSRGTVDNSAWSSASEDEEQYEQDHYGGRGMPYYQDSDSDL